MINDILSGQVRSMANAVRLNTVRRPNIAAEIFANVRNHIQSYARAIAHDRESTARFASCLMSSLQPDEELNSPDLINGDTFPPPLSPDYSALTYSPEYNPTPEYSPSSPNHSPPNDIYREYRPTPIPRYSPYDPRRYWSRLPRRRNQQSEGGANNGRESRYSPPQDRDNTGSFRPLFSYISMGSIPIDEEPRISDDDDGDDEDDGGSNLPSSDQVLDSRSPSTTNSSPSRNRHDADSPRGTDSYNTDHDASDRDFSGNESSDHSSHRESEDEQADNDRSHSDRSFSAHSHQDISDHDIADDEDDYGDEGWYDSSDSLEVFRIGGFPSLQSGSSSGERLDGGTRSDHGSSGVGSDERDESQQSNSDTASLNRRDSDESSVHHQQDHDDNSTHRSDESPGSVLSMLGNCSEGNKSEENSDDGSLNDTPTPSNRDSDSDDDRKRRTILFISDSSVDEPLTGCHGDDSLDTESAASLKSSTQRSTDKQREGAKWSRMRSPATFSDSSYSYRSKRKTDSEDSNSDQKSRSSGQDSDSNSSNASDSDGDVKKTVCKSEEEVEKVELLSVEDSQSSWLPADVLSDGGHGHAEKMSEGSFEPDYTEAESDVEIVDVNDVRAAPKEEKSELSETVTSDRDCDHQREDDSGDDLPSLNNTPDKKPSPKPHSFSALPENTRTRIYSSSEDSNPSQKPSSHKRKKKRRRKKREGRSANGPARSESRASSPQPGPSRWRPAVNGYNDKWSKYREGRSTSDTTSKSSPAPSQGRKRKGSSSPSDSPFNNKRKKS